ncbi:uncharacterized protein LOC127254606 [Andrographis paniculata]|uniref:uncharacterized protein LOC127254606 n=1 Tax=Andrographis paniculata TaxID=175694 RepID=UPI0021E74AEE|nr:uncharacterized protein LOC127254606 [Andrographis paniculata]
MAAPPVKSQPLHNFSLPQLRWAHKNSSVAGSTSSHPHRFRRRDSPDQHQTGEPGAEDAPADPNRKPPDAAEEENGETKPWNLRPRKEVLKAAGAAAAATTSRREACGDSNGNKANLNCNALRSQRLKDMVEGGQRSGGFERKGKRKVWISLSREEIEEDVYALTGGKPARRPRKWPKNVQKQLDCVFPGLYMVGVAADSYRAMML